MVDVSMADGSLSWLAMVAAAYLADGVVPRRGDLQLAGALICYRPYECADGWVSLGALEAKFWQAFCRGVGREDLIAKQGEAPGSQAHAEVVEIFNRVNSKGTPLTRADLAMAHICTFWPEARGLIRTFIKDGGRRVMYGGNPYEDDLEPAASPAST